MALVEISRQRGETLLEETDLLSQIQSLLKSEIEYIGLINKNGRLEASIDGNGLSLSKEKTEMLCMQKRLEYSMASDLDNEFGAVSYTMTERKNSKFISIPLFSHIILAVMKKSKDHTEVIKKIKKAIRSFKNLNKELSMQESDQV